MLLCAAHHRRGFHLLTVLGLGPKIRTEIGVVLSSTIVPPSVRRGSPSILNRRHLKRWRQLLQHVGDRWRSYPSIDRVPSILQPPSSTNLLSCWSSSLSSTHKSSSQET